MGLFKRNSNAVDLLVAGSGSGALTAAIAAHDAGLRVAIYEKASVVGGGTAYSGGVVWAPCNPMMRAKGIQDSVDDGLYRHNLILDPEVAGQAARDLLSFARIVSAGKAERRYFADDLV